MYRVAIALCLCGAGQQGSFADEPARHLQVQQRLVELIRDEPLPQGVDIAVRVSQQVVIRVALNDNKILESLGIATLGTQAQRQALVAWAQDLVERLVMLARDAVEVHGDDPWFNPDTDVVTRIRGAPFVQAERVAERMFDERFVGSRRHGAGGEEAASHGSEVTVTVRPDRVTWEFGEPITGVVTLLNSGAHRVPISARRARHHFVRVTSEDGESPAPFVGPAIRAGPPPRDTSIKLLLPGQSLEVPFYIATDPMGGSAGYPLTTGVWELGYADMRRDANVETVVHPARIVIRGGERSLRIKSVRSAGSHLVVFREHGVVQFVDSTTGEILQEHTWSDGTPLLRTIVSNDGEHMGYREPSRGRMTIESPIERRVYSIGGGLSALPGGLWPLAFGPRGDHVIGATLTHVVALSIPSGELLWRTPTDGRTAVASPDGRYVLLYKRADGLVRQPIESLSVVSTTDLVEATVRPEGTMSESEVFAGRRGIIISPIVTGGALLLSTPDGVQRQFGRGVLRVVSESADGRFVVVSRHDEHGEADASLEVWRVDDLARLCEIDPTVEIGAVLIAGDGPSVVVFPLIHGHDGAEWIGESFHAYDLFTGQQVHSRIPPGSM